jgi:hypothetical protein
VGDTRVSIQCREWEIQESVYSVERVGDTRVSIQIDLDQLLHLELGGPTHFEGAVLVE